MTIVYDDYMLALWFWNKWPLTPFIHDAEYVLDVDDIVLEENEDAEDKE